MNMFAIPSSRTKTFECMRCGHVETRKAQEKAEE
jgi:hypothetical protein